MISVGLNTVLIHCRVNQRRLRHLLLDSASERVLFDKLGTSRVGTGSGGQVSVVMMVVDQIDCVDVRAGVVEEKLMLVRQRGVKA